MDLSRILVARARSPLLGGGLPLTIAEIPPERLATQKLAVFSRFVPTNVSALSEARFRKSVKSGRGALRAFDRAV